MEVKLGDYLTMTGWIFVITSLCFSAYQIRNNTKLNRSKFLVDVIDKIFLDDTTRNFYYKLNWNEWTFDCKTLPKSIDEVSIDNILYALDTVGYLLSNNLISQKEFDIIAFRVARVIRNKEVKKYLKWLDSQFRKTERITTAHRSARSLLPRLPQL